MVLGSSVLVVRDVLKSLQEGGDHCRDERTIGHIPSYSCVTYKEIFFHTCFT